MNPESTPTNSSGTPAKSPVLPFVAAAVAILALAAVAALFRLRRENADVVIEATPALNPPEPSAPTAGVASAPVGQPGGDSKQTAQPEAAAQRAEPREGDVFEGPVLGLGSRGDGRLRIRGKTVYVPGAGVGETVRFRISRDTGNFLVGERVAGNLPLTELAPLPAPEGGATPAPAPKPLAEGSLPEGVLDGVTASAEAVQPGVVFSVVVTEQDRYAPGTNGFCRIGGFAVVVARAQPGPDRVRIRITERLERRAQAELVK